MSQTNAPPPPNPPSPEQVKAWLEFEYAQIKSRAAELARALDAFIAAHPEIEDDETLGKSADLRDQVRALRKSAETGHDAAKAPFLAGGRAVDGWFKVAVTPVDDPLTKLLATMTRFANRKFEAEEAARREAARIAREEAERKAEEAAAAVLLEPPGSDRAQEAVTEAMRAEEGAVEAAAATEVKPAELTRVHGEFGGVASLRTVWKWRVVDQRRVPEKFKDINSARVNAAFKAGGRNPDGSPKLVIPGLETYPDRSV